MKKLRYMIFFLKYHVCGKALPWLSFRINNNHMCFFTYKVTEVKTEIVLVWPGQTAHAKLSSVAY